MQSFIMPLVTMVIGIISLFVDPKQSRWGLGLTLAGLTLTTALTVGINLREEQASRRALNDSVAREKQTTAILLNLTEQTRPIPDLVAMLRGFGFSTERAQTATAASVSRSVEANRAYQGLLRAGSQKNGRIRVEYFPKDVDGEKVVAAMQEAGLRVEQKRPVRQEATNAVWVGDEVPIEAAKLVGLALARAGLELVAIRRFRDGSGPKATLIQVGADAALVGRAPLTIQDIASLTSVSRDAG